MRILIVEDSATDRQLLRYLLEDKFMSEAKFREASNLATAVKYLDAGNIDCVLLDLQLPDSAGKETFEKLISRFPDVPIIVMTNNKDRDLAVNMIKLGAADYILKSYTDEEELFRRIVFAIEKHRRTVRMPIDNASSIHKLERAQANLASAHKSGEHGAIRSTTMETTTAIADLSKSLFTELQAISGKLTQQDTRVGHMEDIVRTLEQELLKGHPTRASMRSQVDLIDHRLTQNEQGLKSVRDGLKHDDETQRMSAVSLHQTRMTNKTKLLLGVLTLIGAIATAVASYEASNGGKADTGHHP